MADVAWFESKKQITDALIVRPWGLPDVPTVSVTVVISLVVCLFYLCDSPIERHHTVGYVTLRT